jgi:hypothetical protein
MASWTTYDGGSLPQYVNDKGYKEIPANGKLETSMDSGPKQMRNLFTATPTDFAITMSMTSDQVTTLDTFYRTECKNGTLEFTWIHPRSHGAVTMRFTGIPPSSSAKAYNTFTVTFTVEILP